MARPITYVATPKQVVDPAYGELEDFLRVLHQSGTLRTLKGLVGRFSELTEIIVKRLNTPDGRNSLGNLAAAATSWMDIRPRGLEKLLRGVTQWVTTLEASEDALRNPPGMFRLLGRLQTRDARRGMLGLVLFLEALGRELETEGEAGEADDDEDDGSPPA